MTDPVTFLRDADPAARGPHPEAGARMDAAMDELLDRVVLDDRRPSPRAGTRTRGRFAFLATAATAAAAVAVGLAALPGGTAGTPVSSVAPPAASAAVVLGRLGEKAAGAERLDGKYVYLRTLAYVTHMRPRGDGGSFATIVPHDVETWVARDGSVQIVRERQRWDEATYPTRDDRAAAATAVHVPQTGDNGARSTEVRIAGFSIAELRALPTDPVLLRPVLERAALGYRSPSPLVTAAALVLGSPLTPPEVRAAAFAVLRELPSAQRVPGVTDPKGRSGEAIEFDGEAWRTLLLFDPKTSELLATRSIGKHELPGRSITDWTLHLDTRGTDAAPAAQPRMPDLGATGRKRGR